jgi:hypothetical protein
VLLHGLHHAVTVQAPSGACYGLGADLDGFLGHDGLVPEQLGVLGEQVQHVVVDVIHAHILPHELAALFTDELRLLRVLVAPVYGGLDGLADVIPVDWQVVLARDEPPGQDVLEERGDKQHGRVACQYVLLAYRPRIPFYVNLVPASISKSFDLKGRCSHFFGLEMVISLKYNMKLYGFRKSRMCTYLYTHCFGMLELESLNRVRTASCQFYNKVRRESVRRRKSMSLFLMQ